MSDRTPTRRRLIQTVGAGALFGLAGCSGRSSDTTPTNSTETATPTATPTPAQSSTTPSSTDEPSALDLPTNDDDLPKDTDPDDGYPPKFDAVPEKRYIDTGSFDTLQRAGMTVKLVPTDVAYYWYVRREARFADARSQKEFNHAHIFGAVLSPAGDGVVHPDDPVLDWPKEDRIITYCACPHHLSTLRAASLMERGYTEVYALDKGFRDWREKNLPLAGKSIGRMPPIRTIKGRVPDTYAGEYAWAYHVGTKQREAAPIDKDGTYALHTKFVDVSGSSKVKVETPAYTLTATFNELTSGIITENGTIVSSGRGTPTDGTGTIGNGTGTSGNSTGTTGN